MAGSGLTEITTLTEEAFNIRKRNFTNDVHYYAPGLKSYEITGFNQKNPNAFLPISTSGAQPCCGYFLDRNAWSYTRTWSKIQEAD